VIAGTLLLKKTPSQLPGLNPPRRSGAELSSL